VCVCVCVICVIFWKILQDSLCIDVEQLSAATATVNSF